MCFLCMVVGSIGAFEGSEVRVLVCQLCVWSFVNYFFLHFGVIPRESSIGACM